MQSKRVGAFIRIVEAPHPGGTQTIFFCRAKGCQMPFSARKGRGGRTYCEDCNKKQEASK